MYCDKCNKQSPDNFTNCAYCGAPLKQKRAHVPAKFTVKRKAKPYNTFKNRIIALAAVAVIIAVVSALIGILSGAKPESVVKTVVKATPSLDEKAYYSVYDDYLKSYYKEYVCYDETVTFEKLTEPLRKSDSFYKKKCGDDYKLTYEITSTDYMTDSELSAYSEFLSENYSYKKLPSDAVRLGVSVFAKGSAGEYTTIYKDFYCVKLSGKWYKAEPPENAR